MNTAAESTTLPPYRASRILSVVRMQLVNRATFVWVPLIILGGALAISLAIWLTLTTSGVTGTFYGGGSQAPLWYFLVVGVQALTLTFPFSQAMSVSRREFYLGTMLTAALSAAFLAAVFVAGGAIEEATDGWGVNGYFFYLDAVWERGPAAAALIYFTVAMLFFVVGFWAATIFKRFGTIVLTTVLIGIAVVLVVAVFVISRMGAWTNVFAWIGEQGAFGMALWGILVVAVLAVLSFLTLRRAVP